MAGLSRLAADLVGVALALMLATLVTAYLNEVRIPALGWQLAEQALDDREISCPGRHCARAGSTAGRAISPALSVPASACPTGATPK